jgi:DNA-directed RNA polymerase specialized sigma54-like protein
MKFLRTATFRDYDMLFAFTDGIQNAILEKRNSKFFPFKDFFETMASFTEENSSSEEMSADIKEMLESQRFKNISSDDKTFGVIYYGGEN